MTQPFSPHRRFSLRARSQSFVHAARGLATLWKTQPNARVHGLATALVLAAAWLWGSSRLECCALILAVSLVWMAECFNTALEFACDFVSPDDQVLIGKAKDVAAAAVLVSAIGALAVGLLIFGPHFVRAFAP